MSKIALTKSRSVRERYYLIRDGKGMGGAGNPTEHYLNNWVVVNGVDLGNGYQGYMSVDYAIEILPAEAATIIRQTIFKYQPSAA